MQHKHKTASRIKHKNTIGGSQFSLQTTFHEEFELLIISDNSILLSSEKCPFSERDDQLQVILLPRYIQLRNGLADKHHANFDFSLVFHGIMSIEFNSNSEWIVLEIVIYVYTWCMIFQINFEADVDLFFRGGLCKQHNIIHSWQFSIGVGVQSVVHPNV